MEYVGMLRDVVPKFELLVSCWIVSCHQRGKRLCNYFVACETVRSIRLGYSLLSESFLVSFVNCYILVWQWNPAPAHPWVNQNLPKAVA